MNIFDTQENENTLHDCSTIEQIYKMINPEIWFEPKLSS